MARVITGKLTPETPYQSEKDVLNFITHNLPPNDQIYTDFYNFGETGQDEYIVLPNIEISDYSRNSFLEIDLIVVSNHSIFLIEVKSWSGKISGDDSVWESDNYNEQRNPNISNNYKAKVLKSLLSHHIQDFNIFVQGIVVISNRETILNLEGNCKNTTFHLDQNLINFITTPKTTRRADIDLQEKIVEVITKKSNPKNYNKEKKDVIDGYIFEKTLSTGNGLTEYLAYSYLDEEKKLPKRIRIFNLPYFIANNNELSFFREKILKNHKSISLIGGHKNIGNTTLLSNSYDQLAEISDWSHEGTLRDFINSNKNISIEKTMSIVKGIAYGLKEAHSKDIIHRNLKPENILMINENPKIINFDLAKEGFSTNIKTIWKTISDETDQRYLPYELSFPMDSYDFYESSDLYSLGVIFYELLCNNVPYSTPGKLERAGGKLPEEKLPSKLNSNIPDWIDSIVLKLYATELDDRYQDADSLLKDLKEKYTSYKESSTNQSDVNLVFNEGEVINNFKIIKHLNTGGFSQVYQAVHIPTDEEYALKVINNDLPIDFFKNEIKLLKKIDHKNIVKVSWGEQLVKNRFYIAMEYLNGNSLQEYIDKNLELSLDFLFDLTKNLLSALRYLHEQEISIYHKDIKPSNIIFVPEKGCVLIDFNISNISNKDTVFTGSPSYIPPDLREDNKWNDSGDTFALGVVLYELAFKNHPYPNKQPRFNKVINPLGFEIAKSIPIDFSNFIFKSVQPLEENRFKTAKDMEKSFFELLIKNNYMLPDSDIYNDEIDKSLENKLAYSLLKNGVNFSFFNGNKELKTIDWEKIADQNLRDPYILLSELVDNGNAEKTSTYITIDYDEIVKLSDEEHNILNIPSLFPFIIRIDSYGDLSDKEFKYKWGFYEHNLGKQLFMKRTGCIVWNNDNTYCLSKYQYNLCKKLDEYNSIEIGEKSYNKNLLFFSEIKELAIKSNSILDSYLQNENVFIPSNMSLKITKDSSENLDILPEILSNNDNQFEKKFDKFSKIQNIYNLENDEGERTRVVFSPKQEEELNKVKKYRKIKKTDDKKFLFSPQEIFDPEIIDLDKFSKRVIEIGIYKPRFYPFISNYKSEWIPGFMVEEGDEKRTKFSFDTIESLNEFKNKLEKDISEKKENLVWEDVSIPFNDAYEIIDVAEKQLSDKSKPVKSLDNKKVLIVKENIEEIEYCEDKHGNENEKYVFIHKYTKPNGIKEGISILDHQKEGVSWLQSLYNDGYSGALLADDMGLGKTLQVLSFIKWHDSTKNDTNKPYLIVAPVSLLENWQTEYEKFFYPSDLSMIPIYGSNADLFFNKNDSWEKKVLAFNNKSVFLTTYETMRRNQFVLCAVEWSIVVLDEAQKIKTPGTLITNAVKALKADFKISATGTPVENTLVDLWCITDFSVPGLLGSAKEFAKEFQNPLKSEDTDLKLLGESLRNKIGVYLKRRMKIDILKDLPKKELLAIKEDMPTIQIDQYTNEIKKLNNTLDGNNILRIIHNLRNICDHPYLIDNNIYNFTSDELISTSAKLKLTIDVLNQIKLKNEKVILFSDKKETQKLLSKVIVDKFNIFPKIINGDTPSSNANPSKESRQKAIDNFESVEGFNIIIMSPIAAGFGLNVTGANHVIHYSRHWNPAKEDQATDRAYRIGQKRNVLVYFPMSVSNTFKSFDIVINELLDRKRSLANASLFPTQKAEISSEDILKEIKFDVV